MKIFFDYLPLVILYGVYLVCRYFLNIPDDTAFAYGAYAFAGSAWLLVGYSLTVQRKVEALHWFLAVLATAGVLFIVFANDSFFFKFKSSIQQWLIALVLLGSIFVGKKTLLERLMGDKLPAPHSAWKQLTWMAFICLALLGCMNAYFALEASNSEWINFKLISGIGLGLIMTIAGGKIMWPYIQAQQETLEAEQAAGTATEKTNLEAAAENTSELTNKTSMDATSAAAPAPNPTHTEEQS